MEFEFTFYAIPLFLGVMVLLAVMVVVWQRRSTRGATEFLAMTGLIALYALAYAFEISSLYLSDVQTWLKIEYVGIVFAPVMLMAVVLHYANAQRMLTPLFYLLLSVIPMLTLMFAWTNESFELIWKNMRLDRSAGFTRTLFDRGDWYMVQIAYLYILSFVGVYVLYRAQRMARGVIRRQLSVLLVALFIPTAVHILYIAEITPKGLDVNPYALTVTAVIIAWGMLEYDLLDVMPVAREAVLQGMSEAVIVLDAANKVVYLNPTARQLAGITTHEAVGRPAEEVFARWADVARVYWNLGGGRAEVTADVYGVPRVFDMQQTTLRTNRGVRQGRLYVLRDVTDRKSIELQLTQTNQQLYTLRQFEADLARNLDLEYVLDTAIEAVVAIAKPDVVVVALQGISEEGLVIARMWVAGNMITTPHLKWSLDSLGGATAQLGTQIIQPIVPPHAKSIHAASQSRLVMPLIAGEKKIGMLVTESENAAYFTDNMCDLLHLLMPRIAMAIDNAQVYEERQKLIAELEAFAHTVAHDLKNPLASITGAADLLRDPEFPLSAPETQELFKSIHRNTLKATQIVNALLTLAGVRITAHVEMVPLDIRAILKEVCERLEGEIKKRSAAVAAPEKWPVVMGYAPWVEEIWINYLSNALKYANQPPIIEVGYDQSGENHVRFWVQDNGPGLTHEAQQKLFQPFTRLTQARIEGHGLGLSIVQRIAERLGGEVGVESTVGEGSRFYFTLPLARMPVELPSVAYQAK